MRKYSIGKLLKWDYFYLVCIFIFQFCLFFCDRKELTVVLVVWFLGWIVEGRYKHVYLNFKQSKLFYKNSIIHVFLFLLSLSLTLFYTDDLLNGKVRIETQTVLWFFPVFFLGMKDLLRRSFNKILYSFVFISIISCCTCWGVSFYELFTSGVWNPYYSHFSFYLHPSYHAMYLSIAAYYLLYNILQKQKYIFLQLILLIILSITIICLSSKAGIFAFFAMLISTSCLYVFSQRNYKQFLTICIPILILLFVVIKYNPRMQTLTNSMERELKSDSSLRMARVNIWHEAYSTVQDHLLLGNGIGDADNLLLERFQKGNYPKSFYQFDCHNQYLEYVLIGGVFTLFVFLIILCYPLLYAVICKDYLFIAFIIMVMVHFCVETMLTIAHGLMFFAFFINLFWVRLEQFNSGDYIVFKFKEKAYIRILLPNIIRIK